MHKKTFKLVLSKNIFFYFISLFVFWIDIIMNRTKIQPLLGPHLNHRLHWMYCPLPPPPCMYIPTQCPP